VKKVPLPLRGATAITPLAMIKPEQKHEKDSLTKSTGNISKNEIFNRPKSDTVKSDKPVITMNPNIIVPRIRSATTGTNKDK